MTRQDAIALWLRHVDGETLNKDEQAGLLHAWEADPGLRALCEADSALDATLCSRPGDADTDAAFITGMTTVLRTQADGGVFAAKVNRRIQRSARLRRRQRRLGTWAWAMASAACLAALIAGAWLLKPPAPDLPRLNGADPPLAVGSSMHPDADAVLMWTDGTRAVVARGSALEILSSADGKSLALGSGRIVIDAAKQPTGRPLTVRTPEAIATVVGTRFVLDCAAGTTRLAVSEGSVRLGGGGQELAVGPGSRALADGRGTRADTIAVWSWSAGDPLPPSLQRGHLGQAPDGRACLISERHTSSVVAVVWGSSPDGLFPYDPDSEVVGDIWLDEHVAWAGVYAQDDGVRRNDGARPTQSHHGQADLPLARGSWHRFSVRLRELVKTTAGPELRPGDRVTHLVFQAQFPGSAVIHLDRLEVRPPQR